MRATSLQQTLDRAYQLPRPAISAEDHARSENQDLVHLNDVQLRVERLALFRRIDKARQMAVYDPFEVWITNRIGAIDDLLRQSSSLRAAKIENELTRLARENRELRQRVANIEHQVRGARRPEANAPATASVVVAGRVVEIPERGRRNG